MPGEEMNSIYRRMALGDIPWNIETPPKELVALMENGIIPSGKVIDLGCGAGNYSRYLAGQGFEVTGVDISSEAIKIAVSRAESEGLACRFICADLSGDLPADFPEGFDFALEWEVLHHIYPEQRSKYVGNVHKLLKPGGKYLSVCFHENNTTFEGKGKYRKTRIGTLLYFSNEEELRDLYFPYFRIFELQAIEIEGKSGRHLVNYAVLEKC